MKKKKKKKKKAVILLTLVNLTKKMNGDTTHEAFAMLRLQYDEVWVRRASTTEFWQHEVGFISPEVDHVFAGGIMT